MKIASDRNLLALIAAAALALAIGTAFSPVGQLFDRVLDPLRFAALGRPASGKVVLVEADAASVAAIKRWPWPRENYAEVVDRLRQAGAASIAFDIDFSSTLTPEGDAAFAAALARADGLVALPTFSQAARSSGREHLDSLPIPALRDHATLASVTVAPDDDGVMRRAPLGTVTAGIPRPSLSAFVSRRSGQADRFFPIDYAIDPATIPRLSFVAVRDGHFDARLIKGRDIVIGATAVELGDRYATPRWSVIPGVVVQALAAETLLRGAPDFGSGLVGIVLALLLSPLVLGPNRPGRLAAGMIASVMLLIGAALAGQATLLLFYPLAPGLVLLLAAAAGRGALYVWRLFEDQRLMDEASGLPNRRAMLADLAGTPFRRVAVAHISNFETIGAVLGAEANADLIGRIADRLRLACDGGAIYRIADRLLAFELARDEDEEAAMAGLRVILLQPVEVKGRRIDASITLGIADGVRDPDHMLTAAAMAADAAARDGIFWRRDAADLVRLEREVSLMGELDQAIEGGDIEVYYQPKLALADDRITSVEALVRWHHRARGFIGPDLFIPLAEQTDRIAPLTLYVLQRVMTDVARWRALGHDATAAVNISAKLVASPAFGEAVRDLLARGIVPPFALVFEVTESATLADPDAAARALAGFRDLGVAISMDDYGTGQSTLTYLRELPLSELKIDRSFVQHVHRNRNDAVLVRSTVQLAHDLGLKVVAEGVEEPECLQHLRELGCDMAQGYLISRPLPVEPLIALLGEYADRPGEGVRVAC